MKRGETHRRRRGAGHFLLLGLLLCGTLASASDAPLDRIAFGSCNRSDQAQPIWPAVLQFRPQLWIWSGDIIYADTEEMDRMAKLYQQQKSQPDYQKLLACCQVIGTWDDHDYGRNDGDRSYRQKVESQRLLLDFLDEPASSPRRRQAGVYASHLQGPPGQRVKVILLDTRSQREPPGPMADMLGAEQWQWLTQELDPDSAELFILVSSIQVIPVEHRHEKWANHPASRTRLLQLLADARLPALILLSGDRHFAEIMRIDLDTLPYPLFEVTSSGLTHSWKRFPGEPNRYRIGEPYTDLHHGVLLIDWQGDQPRVEVQIRDRDGHPQLRQPIQFNRNP